MITITSACQLQRDEGGGGRRRRVGGMGGGVSHWPRDEHFCGVWIGLARSPGQIRGACGQALRRLPGRAGVIRPARVSGHLPSASSLSLPIVTMTFGRSHRRSDSLRISALRITHWRDGFQAVQMFCRKGRMVARAVASNACWFFSSLRPIV